MFQQEMCCFTCQLTYFNVNQYTYTTNGLSKACLFKTTIQPAQAWLLNSNKPHPTDVARAPQWDANAVMI